MPTYWRENLLRCYTSHVWRENLLRCYTSHVWQNLRMFIIKNISLNRKITGHATLGKNA